MCILLQFVAEYSAVKGVHPCFTHINSAWVQKATSLNQQIQELITLWFAAICH